MTSAGSSDKAGKRARLKAVRRDSSLQASALEVTNTSDIANT